MRAVGGREPPARVWTRWVQLALASIAMMTASSPQYVWALFVAPLQNRIGVSLAAVQVTIAVFSICQCGLGPLHGYLAERFTSHRFAVFGGFLIGASWVLSSFTTNLLFLWISYGVLSGIGTGMIYVATVDLMTRWFPDRRGLAIGTVAGSYGFGAVVTTFPIAASLQANGLHRTLLIYGLGLGAVAILVAMGMKRPSHRDVPASLDRDEHRRSFTSSEMLREPAFWLLFGMMTMIATGGLMAISQLGAIGRTFGVTEITNVFGLAALPLALTLDRIANGLTRPFFGWVSDHIGREPTMAVAFTLEGFATLALLVCGRDPMLFVLLSGIVFFGWGEIYSLFPGALGDLFGPKHAANNFGWLLIATAIGSVLGGPLAALLFEQSGSWTLVFCIVAALDLAAAILAIVALLPIRRGWATSGHATLPPTSAETIESIV